jgi:hypothetical protein
MDNKCIHKDIASNQLNIQDAMSSYFNFYIFRCRLLTRLAGFVGRNRSGIRPRRGIDIIGSNGILGLC